MIKMKPLLVAMLLTASTLTTASTDDAAYETNPQTIASILNQCIDWVRGMLVHRQGDAIDSNMTALGLHQNVTNTQCYEVSPTSGLLNTACDSATINMEDYIADNSPKQSAPQHATISADWLKEATDIGGNENILGDNVILKVDSDNTIINIPVLEADDTALLYYGAMLVEAGSNIQFPNDSYPIWKMSLGENYVSSYLMSDAGKGFYLEYHYDRPHWHQPLSTDAGGFYLLAREAGLGDDGIMTYHMTGFRIPHGKAVYSKMGAIHADPGLYGSSWVVGYSDSEHFSTALVRNKKGQMIRFKPAS